MWNCCHAVSGALTILVETEFLVMMTTLRSNLAPIRRVMSRSPWVRYCQTLKNVWPHFTTKYDRFGSHFKLLKKTIYWVSVIYLGWNGASGLSLHDGKALKIKHWKMVRSMGLLKFPSARLQSETKDSTVAAEIKISKTSMDRHN